MRQRSLQPGFEPLPFRRLTPLARCRAAFGAAALAVLLLAVGAPALAATIGWRSNNPGIASGPPTWVDPSASISAAGHTPVMLSDLSAASLATVDAAWYFNASNSNHVAELVAATADIEAFVAAGGFFLLGDWSAGSENRSWLGLDATSFTFAPNEDLTVIDPAHTAVDGAGGTVDDTSLDGLSQSSHGYAALATLPAGAVAVLRQAADPGFITDFHHAYGAGTVYYSTQPLPFKTERTAYVTNLADLTGRLVVPEPGTAVLLFGGLLALACGRSEAR